MNAHKREGSVGIDYTPLQGFSKLWVCSFHSQQAHPQRSLSTTCKNSSSYTKKEVSAWLQDWHAKSSCVLLYNSAIVESPTQLKASLLFALNFHVLVQTEHHNVIISCQFSWHSIAWLSHHRIWFERAVMDKTVLHFQMSSGTIEAKFDFEGDPCLVVGYSSSKSLSCEGWIANNLVSSRTAIFACSLSLWHVEQLAAYTTQLPQT